MRLAALACLLAACSIPDKTPVIAGDDDGAPDAGVDATPDTDAPDTKLDEQPAQFSSTGQAVFQFSSTDETATFVCRVDEEAPAPCLSPFNRALADGSHSFSVRAIDAAGNMDETPAERVWTIDTVAPDTQLVIVPPAADNSTMAVFTFKSAERNVTFDCQLDNRGFAPCTSGASFGPVADGAHAFAVRAKDRAGNLDPSPAIYAWSVDTSTPDTTILTGPATASAVTTASFTFFSPDAGGGATFACALDGGPFVACTSPRAFSDLAEGSHTFQVRVRDAVGNVDPSPASKAWTVDLTTPQTTISDGPSGATGVASASFVFAASEPDVTFTCSLDGGSYADCTSPASFTALAQGAHSFAVRATDLAGHVDATPATGAWTVDTIAPDLAITSAPAATSGPRVAFSFNASDGTVTCSFDGAAFTACTSPLATNLPAGSHTLQVRAIDAANNATMVGKTWSVACAGPAATGAAGLLHLDDIGQVLTNAVAGGADATLGDSDATEAIDPVAIAPGRFVGGLSFDGTTHAAWPVALTAQPDLTIELWARANAVTGARELVASGDGRALVRATMVSATTVRFSVSIVEAAGGATRTVQSAAVEAGAWHHVIASLQAPALRLWVDGVRTDIATVALDSPVGLDGLRLGGAGGTGYDGALDEVWVAQTAIASDEAALQRYCPLP